MRKLLTWVLVLLCVAAPCALLTGCLRCGAYYKALEKVGYEKRDLLVKRVSSARDAQKDAQQQFRDALEEYKSLVGYKGGKLEDAYEKLRAAHDDSKRRADEVHTRIANVQDVATRLFSEWRQELTQYSDASLRAESQRELDVTQRRYGEVIRVMEKAAKSMDPVLARLNDQVLFLKHNLNARALGSLQGTADALQAQVAQLVAEMEGSIAEATKFIDEMAQDSGRAASGQR